MTTPTLRDAAMAALKALSVVTSTLMRPEKHMKVVRDLRLALTAPEQSPADAPAAPTSGEPPSTAAQVRDFIGSQFSVLKYGREDHKPCDEDRYTLTAHDLISAFLAWTTFDRAAAPGATPPSAAQAEGAKRDELVASIKSTAEHWAYMAEIDNGDAANEACRKHAEKVDELAALTAAPEKVEGPCSPTLTECPRCKNEVAKCDGVFSAPAPHQQAAQPTDDGGESILQTARIAFGLQKAQPETPVPQQAGQDNDEFETRADGKRVRKDRWQWGIRRIVALLWGNRHEFEVDEVVEAVRKLLPTPFADGEDEALVDSVGRGLTPGERPKEGGHSYEASMLRNLLARIHGDGGHYVAEHGLDAALEAADQLVADWRAAQGGREGLTWVPMHERAPEPDTDCVVLLRYTIDRPPFLGIDRWEMQREDPTGMGGPTMETGYGWNDNFESDVIGWAAITNVPPESWDQRVGITTPAGDSAASQGGSGGGA